MTETSWRPGVAIVGCGLIGKKRAQALGPARLVSCVDKQLDRARELAASKGAHAASDDWMSAVSAPEVEIVIVATSLDVAPAIALAAVESGKHVLVEKPAARRAAELRPVLDAATRRGAQVRVGFNHRFHPALLKAQDLFRAGALGEMMFVRGRYGHGGRPGYE